MERMILTLGVPAEVERNVQEFLDSQQIPGSPNYHQWLTPEEFGRQFGPSPEDIAQVKGWLQQQGFRVNATARSGRWIEFSGTSAQVEAAFQTDMRRYQVGGEAHIANAADISIPAALSPVVRGVVSLHDFFKKPRLIRGPLVRRAADGRYATVNPDANFKGNTVHALAPGDFAKIYNLNPLYNTSTTLNGAPVVLNGSGQTIAIVARSTVNPQDVADFRATFGLPPNSPNIILNGQPQAGVLPELPGDDIEAILDTEWSGAAAPGATIDLVVSPITATADGVDLSAAFIVDQNLAPVMNVSFGACERDLGPSENAFFSSLWQQAAAQGISVFVSSGDDGAAGCDDPATQIATGGLAVNGLASTPFNSAVGGTEFAETLNGLMDATFWAPVSSPRLVSALGYIPETVWNESQGSLFAGSGGLSAIYATPSWQTLNVPGLAAVGTQRGVPDVSLTAALHDGYLVCFGGSCAGGAQSFLVVGGTSASSPSFAGIMAIVDQKIAGPSPASPLAGRQGLANYVMYLLAAAEKFTACNSSNRTNPATPAASQCVFNDVTAGNDSVPGQTGFNTASGYDLATGLGSVDATNLVNAWAASTFQASQTALSASTGATIKITHGTPVSFTVSVQKAGGGAGPTGSVALVTDANGGNIQGSPGVGALGPLVTGSAAGTFNNLPGGTYNLSANYPGDGVFAASTSNNIPAIVQPENSTITLSASTIAVPKGTTVTVDFGNFLSVQSTVAGQSGAGFPSGQITLTDSFNGTSTQLGQVSLTGQGQQAEIFLGGANTPANFLPGTQHSVTASYGGDNSFNPSGPSAPVSITITKGNPMVRVAANPASTVTTVPVTLTALILPIGGGIVPTGTVQFFDGTTALGQPVVIGNPSGNVSQGVAQVTLASQGTHSITAQYSGDTIFNSAASLASSVAVDAPFGFTGTTVQTIMAGQTATYNLSLNQTNFTGMVSIVCSGAPGGTTCAANPNAVSLTPASVNTSVTITVSNTSNAQLSPGPFGSAPFVFAAVLAGLVLGARRKPKQAFLLMLAALLLVGISSCGGHASSPPPQPPPPPTNATLTVTATSPGPNGTLTSSISLTLTITH
ncbi:MAG TPA: Ig-like domain repeat protein [Candidatus Acidoferrales bacterium]|nr:Ig-like domain repeat protein [Candidatus Acidoferrales bacterium]